MHDSNGATTSLWQDIQPSIPADGQQAPDMTVDVCIVGAGISGLSVAYMLSQAGKKVVVLDDDAIGGTMTSRTMISEAASAPSVIDRASASSSSRS